MSGVAIHRLGTPWLVSPPPLAREAARLQIRLIGSMEATTGDGLSVLPRTRKARALLAILVLLAPQKVARTTLASLLWSRRGREQARGSLRQALLDLHGALLSGGVDRLHASREHLALPAEGLFTDLPAAGNPAATRLLEDLRGLDPAFDLWIADHIAALCPRSLAATTAGLPPGVAPIGGPNDRAGSEGRLRLGVMKLRTADGETRSWLDQGIAEPAPGDRPAPGLTAAGQSVPGQSVPGLGVAGLGMAGEIASALSRFGWMVLPSILDLSGMPDLRREDARALGIDFLLDGTAQTVGPRLRLHLGLHDVRSGELAWAHSFDRPAADLLDVQGDIAAETVGRLDAALLLREGRRLGRQDPATMTPDECVLAALPAICSLEPAAFGGSGTRLQAAIDRAPDHAAAHAWLALWHALRIGQGWVGPAWAGSGWPGNMAEVAGEATRLCGRAIMLDPADPRVLTIAGHVRAAVERRPEEGIALHRRALALNDRLGWAWMFVGLAHCYLGRHREAIEMLAQAKRLSPSDPYGFLFDMALTLPHLLCGDHARAIALARQALALNPALAATALVLLAALGHAGSADEQLGARHALLAIDPAVTVAAAMRRLPLQMPADRAHFAAGLRRAGLAE